MADITVTLAERGARYGDFTDHAKVAQDLQEVMHSAPGGDWRGLSPVQKQALTVIADKIARILTGDPDYRDNWHDIQGYARLAEDRCVEHGQETLPFADMMHTHGNVERQSDEYFCCRCAKRWGTNEPAPVCV